MPMNLTLWLLVAAVLVNGLLVGASLDQTIKQLPARRRIGPVAFSEYSKAGDAASLAVIFDRFERWSRARSALQALTLLAVARALVTAIAAS
jgi:hypothetical protein